MAAAVGEQEDDEHERQPRDGEQGEPARHDLENRDGRDAIDVALFPEHRLVADGGTIGDDPFADAAFARMFELAQIRAAEPADGDGETGEADGPPSDPGTDDVGEQLARR